MSAPNATSSQVYCTNCGERISAGTSYCRRCGNPVAMESENRAGAGATSGPGQSADAAQTPASSPWRIGNGIGYGTTVAAFPPWLTAPDHLNDTFVAAGKILTLVMLHGIALAVVFRFIMSGVVQAAVGLIVQGLGDRLLSSANLSQLGLGGLDLSALTGPLHGAIGQIAAAVGRSIGAPALPGLMLFTMLGVLVTALVPITMVLAADLLGRWGIFGVPLPPGDARAKRSGGELALASAKACVRWLAGLLPYAGVALLLSLIGLASAVVGFLLWLLAGAMLLNDQLAPRSTFLRLALPAVYSVAVVLMVWIAAQGGQSWGA